jgi:hypothetical protein
LPTTVSLSNSTFWGNGAGTGGAIANQGLMNVAGTLAITSSTLVDNRATSGGGIFTLAGTLTVGNTILALNSGSTGPDVDGTVHSLGHNLVGHSDGSSGWVAGDLTGTLAAPLDPQLGILQNNGGPTLTLALLTGSPAIDAGDNAQAVAAGLTTDQRGQPRIVNGTIDIGAYEAPATDSVIGMPPPLPPGPGPITINPPGTNTPVTPSSLESTQTTLSASMPTSVWGQSVLFTATISSPVPGPAIPTGLVSFVAQNAYVTPRNGGNNYLEGGGGFDLFFAAAGDQLYNQKKGDRIIGL